MTRTPCKHEGCPNKVTHSSYDPKINHSAYWCVDHAHEDSNAKPYEMKCRGCGKALEGDDYTFMASYGYPFHRYPVHTACQRDAIKEEAYEVQNLDSNCNDCVFFKRLESPDSQGVSFGECQRFSGINFKYPRKAVSNNYQGWPCFVHRRDPDQEIHG